MSTEAEKPKAAANRATRLTILCRGATAANRHVLFSCDGSLPPKEFERSQTLARGLRPFDTVLHAPERGARETALAFSSRPVPCLVLGDVDYGRWSGRTIADVAGQSPEDFQRWMSDPACAPHGGESFEAARARAAAWLAGLPAKGGNILAVTHGIVLKLLLAHVLAAPSTAIWRIDVAPLGMLALTGDGRRWALRTFGSGFPAGSHC